MKTDLNNMECDILVALSDFKPRNQNQIADLIGSHEKSTDRVHVSRCLKNIKSYLKHVFNGFGESGNKWVLKQDIEAFREIIIKYPSLIPDLQKNDKIRGIIAKNFHPDLPAIKEFEDEVNVFTNMLRGSPTLFKLVLQTSPETLRDRFLTVYVNSPDGIYRRILEDNMSKNTEENDNLKTIREEGLKIKFPDGLTLEDKKNLKLLMEFHDSVYEACVQMDILNGQFNSSAIDYIRKKNEYMVIKREKDNEIINMQWYKAGQKNPTAPYVLL